MQVAKSREAILDVEPTGLVDGLCVLEKSVSEDETWKFIGVASDDSVDTEGDTILRKALDLTYAQERGYVNWDHKRDPSFQIGFLTEARIINPDAVDEIAAETGLLLAKSSSVLVKGELYKYVPRAVEVQRIMKSMPKGRAGLGLSLDGAMARDMEDNDILKAFVRGVAITPVPAHPKTLLQLQKSLSSYSEMDKLDNQKIALDSAEKIAQRVVELMKSVPGATETLIRLTDDEAILWLLKSRPNWNYDLAQKVLQYTKQRTN